MSFVTGPEPPNGSTPPENGAVDPPQAAQSPSAEGGQAAQRSPYYPVEEPQAARTPPVKTRRNSAGCVITAIITVLLVIILVGVGLLLPPFSLLEQLNAPEYAPLNPGGPALTFADGLALLIDPDYPGENFAAAVEAIPAANYAEALPPSLTLISPVYTITTQGIEPEIIGLNLPMRENLTAYDTIDLYTYDKDAETWQFAPAQFSEDYTQIVTVLEGVPDRVAAFQSSAALPNITVPVEPEEAIDEATAATADSILAAGLHPTRDGRIEGSLPVNFQTGAGYNVFLTIRNFDDPAVLDLDTVQTILADETTRRAHISELVGCALNCYQGSAPVSGLAVDYRGLDENSRAAYSTFIVELARNLRSYEQELLVVLPMPVERVGEPWDTGAYDWRIIGRAADLVQVTAGSSPIDYIPGGLVERMLRWGVGEINRYKLQVSMPVQHFQQIGFDDPVYTPILFSEAMAAFGDVEIVTASEQHYFLPGTTIEAQLNGLRITSGFNDEAQSPYIDYDDSARRVWITTGDTLTARLSLLRQFNIGGAALRGLLDETASPDALNVASAFRLNELAPSARNTSVMLYWTVTGADGTLIEETETAIGETFQWQANAPDGNYAINAAVISGAQESMRAGQTIAVAAPTSTPAPTLTPSMTPTATSTPTPSLTPTPITPTATPLPTLGEGVPAAAVPNTPAGQQTRRAPA